MQNACCGCLVEADISNSELSVVMVFISFKQHFFELQVALAEVVLGAFGGG